MNFTLTTPPREFTVGQNNEITLKDCGRVELDPDEQVTFTSESGTELDVTKKAWGYFATPSLNKRLRRYGLKGVIVKGAAGDTFFVVLVEDGKDQEFDAFLINNKMKVVCWLDSDEACLTLDAQMGRKIASVTNPKSDALECGSRHRGTNEI